MAFYLNNTKNADGSFSLIKTPQAAATPSVTFFSIDSSQVVPITIKTETGVFNEFDIINPMTVISTSVIQGVTTSTVTSTMSYTLTATVYLKNDTSSTQIANYTTGPIVVPFSTTSATKKIELPINVPKTATKPNDYISIVFSGSCSNNCTFSLTSSGVDPTKVLISVMLHKKSVKSDTIIIIIIIAVVVLVLLIVFGIIIYFIVRSERRKSVMLEQ
jgi:hypothetical protein